ncbi:MAG: NADH-quinone oxidoreductase subunit L [Nitrososphaerota archaeon]
MMSVPAGTPPLLVSLFIPLGLSPFAYLFGKLTEKKTAGVFSHTVLAIPFILTLINFQTIYNGGEIRESLDWIPQLGLTFTLRLDQLSYPFLLLITLIGFLASIYSWRYMEHEHNIEAYYALLMLFVSGMIGVVLSTNLFLFYIFWELMLIPSYFLIAYWGTGNARIIGFKYFAMTHVGAVSLLAGIAWLNAIYGSVEYDVLSMAVKTYRPELLYIAILIFIGAAVKMALFPLHTWLPDAHAEAPTPISVLLSGVMIKTGVYALARLLISFMPGVFSIMAPGIFFVSVLTMFWGGLMALVQTDIKRILAYSSVSQVGYIVFGLSSLMSTGYSGALLHVFTHGLAKSLLFMTAGSVMHVTGERDIRKLGGLFSALPLTSMAFLVGGLSIAGTPPLAGFFSEWMIFKGGIDANQILYTFLAILATALTAGYYLRAFMYAFQLGEAKKLSEAPISMLASMMILVVLISTLAIFVNPILIIINSSISI